MKAGWIGVGKMGGQLSRRILAAGYELYIYDVQAEQMQPLVELGAQTMGKFGNADVRIVDAKKCREIVGRIYRRASEDIFCEFREIPQELYR